MESEAGAPHVESFTEEHSVEVQQGVERPVPSAEEEEGGGRGGQDLTIPPYRQVTQE